MTTERKVLSLRRAGSHLPAITERLHKVLANAGLGSRRALEERIAAGEIRINGEVAQLGAQLNSGDRVELDNRRFAAVPCAPEETRVLMFHKPEGLVTSNDDPEGRPTVFEKLPRLKGARWVSVGRLDINTTGLLLMTTDGELANALMHPRQEVEREYVCRIFGEVTDEHLQQLTAGVELEDGIAAFDEIHEIHRDEKHAWYRVVLREGRNREVRRLWEAMGLTVSRLKRIRYGLVELPRELRRGHHRGLDAEQVRALRHSVGLGDTPQSLTLEPILGQRRAPVRPSNEFRPEPRQQRAWTGSSYEEEREMRAFDRPLLDDRPARRRPRPAGAGAGAARKRGGKVVAGRAPGKSGGHSRSSGAPGRPERGNRAPGPGAGNHVRKPRQPKTMTGPMDSNEMLFRTWYPGSETGRAHGSDDNRGNLAVTRAPVDGNRMPTTADGNRGPRPAAPAKRSNRNKPQRPRGAKPAPRGKGGKPGQGGQQAGQPGQGAKAAPGAGEDRNAGRQRRGPFRRVRKPGGNPPASGGGKE
ncbi:MAG: rRNA pseudouridine synthase [Xanthomonadales bacterium]|nr:rRNA pseudouridine synthase [Xanthomonadales bacterium]